MIKLRKARHDDVVPFLLDVRREDEEEWHIGGAVPMKGFLHMAMLAGDVWAAADEADAPVALFGCTPDFTGDVGCVWLAATNAAPQKYIGIHKACLPVMHGLAKQYRTLRAEAWEGNPVHLKWLTWLGFEVCWRRKVRGETFITYERTGGP